MMPFCQDFLRNGSARQELDELHFLRQVHITPPCILGVDRRDHDLISEHHLVLHLCGHGILRIHECQRLEIQIVIQRGLHILAV